MANDKATEVKTNTPYKILWYSVPALHDNSNGAAIHNKILLEALAQRGFQVKVLNALVADDPRGLEIFNRINAQIKSDPNVPYLQFSENNVEYIVSKTQGHSAKDITAADQGKIFDLYLQLIEKFQPDVIMGYSGDVFSAYLRHEAKVRGISVVYALCNGLHKSFAFADCDLVFAPSEATAKMYREFDGTDVKSVGQFINRDRVVASEREPNYITLVNPTPEKGLAIFVKLAEQFQKRHPEQRFLVVKSVGDYAQCLKNLHYKDGTPFITNDHNPIKHVDVAEHTDDIRLVYKITKALIAPSVWHESWGCVATEAIMNGIPVLATKSGGLPEAVREGGILLDAPESTQNDFNCVPSDEEIAPYVDALERLLNEDWTEACAKASAYNDLDASVDRLLVHLEPLLKQGQENKKPLDQSYFFSARSMERRREAYLEQEKAAAAAAAKADEASETAEANAKDQNAEAPAAEAKDAPAAGKPAKAKSTKTTKAKSSKKKSK